MTAPDLDLEKELNPEQRTAVVHGEGPQLVLAGAGSGKTRVITYRVAWLVRERSVDPAAIVAVTFTNKAAGEMRDRIESLLNLFPLPTFVGTFHRFALFLLRRYGERVGVRPGFVIFDADDQIALVKKALAAEQLSEKSFSPRSVLSAISGAKNRLLGPDAYEAAARGFFEQRVARVFRRYQGLLHEAAAVDFDDMLKLAVELLAEHPDVRDRMRRRIEHLLVDEFQDTNHAQLRLVLELVGPDGNLTAVGDEDQGIYRWRGADLDNILDFERSFPGAVVRKLERNYRSTQNILAAAGDLVAHNERRRGKRLWTESGDGEPIELYKAADELDEARWIVDRLAELRARLPWSEMAILVRTNAQTRALEEELLRREVPYALVGGVRFYERAEIKDVVAYLRVLRNPHDSFSLARILNQPPRGIGRTTQQLLEEAAEEEGLPLWDVLAHDRLGRFPARSARALGEFHALVAGLAAEAESLPLPGLLRRILEATGYLEMYRNKDDSEAEGRLENLEEFLSAAQEFTEESLSRGEEDVLTAFLDHISLVSDIDAWQAERGLSLMTLHSAKGLEFSAVVVAGLEDGLLPHFHAGGAREDIEEERRLLYVGMTRARSHLLLTCCRRRRIAGQYQDQAASPFLGEIPERALAVSQSPELFAGGRTRSVYSFFSRPAPESLAASGGTGGSVLRKGRKVRHATLGQGVILDLEGEGADLKLTVFFDRAGKRKLIARYASLELI